MAVEIDHVETFVAIVRRGGFTRAAASLHLSQPAISRRLHLLERELGRPLFDRARGQFPPTIFAASPVSLTMCNPVLARSAR
jgi:DNA-binding transcriptional LysR family regulator